MEKAKIARMGIGIIGGGGIAAEGHLRDYQTDTRYGKAAPASI